MLQKLKPISEHCAELRALCSPQLFSSNAQLRSHAWTLYGHTLEWQYLTYRTAMRASSDKEWISSTSVDYLMYSGWVTLAAHWLRMEIAACEALAKGNGVEEAEFYKAKVQTSSYVFDRLLPRTRSHKAGILAPVASVMELSPDNFSFDHAR